MSFLNETVLVTGGARGIGKSIVERFAAEGANVAFTYASNEAKARELIAKLKREHPERKFRCYALNVENREECDRVVCAVAADFGAVHVLVNNSGVAMDGLMMQLSDESWTATTGVNLSGVFYMMRAALPLMLGQRGGRIVNISSVSAMGGVEGQAGYCASKAGVVALTKVLAKEMSRKKIRVNAVAPGYIETDMLEALPQELRESYKRRIPARRFGSGDEVASVVSFLAGSDASYICGQTIVVDGGLTA